MSDLKVGNNLELHCYKHNGKINSISDKITVLEVNDDISKWNVSNVTNNTDIF